MSQLRARRSLLAGLVLAATGCAHAERPDLLLVVVDTLRADRLGSYGYAAAGTPHLDRLATGGIRFANAVSPAPLTLPAHA